MKDLAANSCVDFAAMLASDAPVPGGGGAAALAGALAASLGAMAGRLSLGRRKAEEDRQALEDLVAAEDALRQRLLTLIDWDAAGFEPLAQAYGLPRDDPDRKTKLRSASLHACEAPIEMLHSCRETAEVLERIRVLVSPLLLSDVGCAAVLCRGALEAAAMNVWVNTKSLGEDPEALMMNRKVRELLDAALPKLEALAEDVRKTLEIR